MILRFFLCFFFGVLLFDGNVLSAQNSRKVKALQSQKKEMQKELKRSKSELTTAEKAMTVKMRDINILVNQMENRQRYIDTMELQLLQINRQVMKLEEEVASVAKELKKKKHDYAKALRYARVKQTETSPMLFVLSSRTVAQLFRRSRYAREYANYQRTLAEQIVVKQSDLMEKKNDLLKVKAKKNYLLQECERQKAELQKQHEEEQKNVAGLRQKRKVLQKEVEEQQQQLAALEQKIDEAIAYEVEQARLRAEAARKKAEEEAKRKAKETAAQTMKKQAETPQESSIPSEYRWITPEEQVLNGDFVRNRGRLPVPITGHYMVGSHFGTYNVPGLKDVRLDNKGTNYVGKAGAMARSIFDGEVSAVFQFGDTKNVLIRHGSYISVYCNLSSVRVFKGQKVKARDILGVIEDDGSGNCVLHFQLRKETQKLNPEAWIGR